MSNVKEKTFLEELAVISELPIEFKDAKILPGTAWIGGMPIDITIHNDCLILNSVGAFGGTKKTYSKGEFRGKGVFKLLYQGIGVLIKRYGLEEKIYLTPLSPVWEKKYNLVETTQTLKGHHFYLSTSCSPPEVLGPRDESQTQ